jgi:flagellar biosynthesis protein FlhF
MYQSFRGADVKEALSAVKSALGSDALIGATRHVHNGGSGAFGHSYVEVDAAPAPARVSWPFAREARPGEGSRPAARRPKSPLGASEAAPADKRSRWTEAELRREIGELRASIEQLRGGRSPRRRALERLNGIGIEGGLAAELADGAPRSSRKQPEALNAFITARIAERLMLSPSLIARSGKQLIACVGPTGAGTTTTLAKLAARARLDLRRTVGVISLDSFRVGATEQWQRYARLMGLPFHVAGDGHGFGRALAEMRSEIVLVDTAGRTGADNASPLAGSVEQVTERAVHVLLVIPAWMRGPDVERLSATYASPKPSAIVVTKLDEAGRMGGALHAALPNQTPLAYLCDGPRVPEDIDEASPDAVLHWLLGKGDR